MSVLGVILLSVGIMLYVDFCSQWKGPWKVVVSLYACCFGATMLIVKHPWIMSWAY